MASDLAAGRGPSCGSSNGNSCAAPLQIYASAFAQGSFSGASSASTPASCVYTAGSTSSSNCNFYTVYRQTYPSDGYMCEGPRCASLTALAAAPAPAAAPRLRSHPHPRYVAGGAQ